MFFFSSRRRHTRWPRDWTSDVCSSDLSLKPGRSCLLEQYGHPVFLEPVRFITGEVYEWPRRHSQWTIFSQIGRASCREEVQIPVLTGYEAKIMERRH